MNCQPIKSIGEGTYTEQQSSDNFFARASSVGKNEAPLSRRIFNPTAFLLQGMFFPVAFCVSYVLHVSSNTIYFFDLLYDELVPARNTVFHFVP